MLSLNLLAFLFHTVLEWSDDKYALLRQVLARRQTFFHDIQALMRYMVLDSWKRVIDFMIRGLDLESRCDTSCLRKLELLSGESGSSRGPVTGMSGRGRTSSYISSIAGRRRSTLRTGPAPARR